MLNTKSPNYILMLLIVITVIKMLFNIFFITGTQVYYKVSFYGY